MPDANYTREIPRLNSHSNVQTVGYISTGYGMRDLKPMLRDVDVYSNWSSHSLGMNGIFLDETPTQYNFTTVRAYEQIATKIRSASGLGSDSLVSWRILVSVPGSTSAQPDVVSRVVGLCCISLMHNRSSTTLAQSLMHDIWLRAT